MPSPSQRSRSNRQGGTTPPAGTETPAPSPKPPSEREPKLALERIGDMLKREREKRGDDLQQIADYLCIRRVFLEALENNRYDELPADAYVIGFLRSYALFLGLDGNEAIDRYRKEMTGRRRRPELTVPMPITEGRTPSAAILAAAAVAALIIYAVWYGLSSTDRTEVSAAAPPPVAATDATTTATDVTTMSATNPPTATTMEPMATSSPLSALTTAVSAATSGTSPAATTPIANNSAPAPATTATTAPTPLETPTTTDQAAKTEAPAEPMPHVFGDVSGSRIAIRAEKESWVLVTDEKGRTVFDRVLKPGDVYHVPDIDNLALTVGNSNGVVLSVDGRDLPKLAARSSVMRGVALDPDRLKSGDLTPQE
jgi:cytoskeletal protein RodZ